MKIGINYEIGFSDSEIVSYFREGEHLVVKLKTWNDRLLSIAFDDVAGVFEFGLGDVSAFVEETDDSSFLNSVLEHIYEELPVTHAFNIYEFLNMDEVPRLRVVAKSVAISQS